MNSDAGFNQVFMMITFYEIFNGGRDSAALFILAKYIFRIKNTKFKMEINSFH